MAYYIVLRKDQVPLQTYWMKKTSGSHDTLKDIVMNSDMTFSAVSTSSSQAAFSVVASQSFITLKPLNQELEIPSKLVECAEIVADLVNRGLVDQRLMGPALRARNEELLNAEAALVASGKRLTAAR